MKIESKKTELGELEIKLTFDSHDQICLQHNLIDIVEWYSRGPSQEKIHNCKKRLISENKETLLKSPEMQSKSLAEVNQLLLDEKKLCEMIVKLPDYKNRAEREKESNL